MSHSALIGIYALAWAAAFVAVVKLIQNGKGR